MRRGLFLFAALLLTLPLHAITKGGFGLDAFNRAIGATTRGNAVFSPASYEFDTVIFSEAFGALTRAKYAETMGVLTGLESVYKPLYDELSQMTGGVSFVSARAFSVPNERKMNTSYRQWMQNTFAAESFSFAFQTGAECWFHARMDGAMEDFALPEKSILEGFYSYYDLVSVTATWKSPVMVDTWKRRHHVVLRMPLEGENWLFMIVPSEGHTVRDVRGELNSNTLLTILSTITSISEEGVSHSVASVDLPKMDITTECDLKQPFGYFRLPLTDMERMEKNIQPRLIRQCVRFRLNGEKGTDPAEKNYNLNRPFLFFIYHEPNGTIPIAGVYMGRQ